jgi:hypothetical protein
LFDWQKPDFDPTQDPFMKRFDENGNFVPLPKPEEMEVEYDEVIPKSSYTFPYIYTYVEDTPKDETPLD